MNAVEHVTERNGQAQKMSLVEYHEVVDMAAYRANLPQTVDPISHLYKLEQDLMASEQETAKLINALSQRLDLLETRVSSMTQHFDNANRQLERDVVSLAQRVARFEETQVA